MNSYQQLERNFFDTIQNVGMLKSGKQELIDTAYKELVVQYNRLSPKSRKGILLPVKPVL